MAVTLQAVPAPADLDEATAREMCRLVSVLSMLRDSGAADVEIRAAAMIEAGIAVLQTIRGYEAVRLRLERHVWLLGRRQARAEAIGASR